MKRGPRASKKGSAAKKAAQGHLRLEGYNFSRGGRQGAKEEEGGGGRGGSLNYILNKGPNE